MIFETIFFRHFFFVLNFDHSMIHLTLKIYIISIVFVRSWYLTIVSWHFTFCAWISIKLYLLWSNIPCTFHSVKRPIKLRWKIFTKDQIHGASTISHSSHKKQDRKEKRNQKKRDGNVWWKLIFFSLFPTKQNKSEICLKVIPCSFAT